MRDDHGGSNKIEIPYHDLHFHFLVSNSLRKSCSQWEMRGLAKPVLVFFISLFFGGGA